MSASDLSALVASPLLRIGAEDWAALVAAYQDAPAPAGVKPSRRRPPRTARERADAAVVATAWVIALRRAGRLGVELGDGKFAVLCPWDAEHSTPDGDLGHAAGGTVLFPPGAEGQHAGYPWCNHAHCAGRTLRDWVAAIGLEVWTEAVREAAASVHPPRPRPGEAQAPQAQEPGATAAAGPAAAQPVEGLGDLTRNLFGQVKNTFRNVCLVLRHGPGYGARLAWNQMRLAPELDGQVLGDAENGRIREAIERDYGFAPGQEGLRAGLVTVGSEHAYHPVERYLEGLVWDGTPRLERVASEVLHLVLDDADPAGHVWRLTLANTQVRAWFISAVARVYEPGCKVDTALVLVGPQGWRKSAFFRILGGPWFADSAIDLGNKDALLQLHDTWIYEWPEIEVITSQRHAGTVKAFVTSQIDLFRPPYGGTVLRVPRSNVIVGSTNEQRFLEDPTGSRRFWTIDVGAPVEEALLASWRDQLWAEARDAYRAREAWWLGAEAEAVREAASEDHRVLDPWEAPVAAWLAKRVPGKPLTTREILADALRIEVGLQHRGHENRVGSVMRSLGYTHKKRRVSGALMQEFGRELVWEWIQPSTSGQGGGDRERVPSP